MALKYRVVASVHYSPAQFARARRYSAIEDAVAAMGEGVVVRDDGEVAAFHERHLSFVEARLQPAVPSGPTTEQPPAGETPMIPVDDVLETIKTTALSRAAVETSTPEQIVWLTTDAIAENVRLLAHDLHPGHRTVRERMTAQILSAVRGLDISETAKRKALTAINRALDGWPS